MREGQSIGILVGLQSGFVHEPTHGEMRQQQAPDLLAHQLRGFGAQHHPGAAQLCLQFRQCNFDFPAFMVEGGQLCRGRPLRVENGDTGGEFRRPAWSGCQLQICKA